jgi:hypothetical protein
MRVKKQVVLLFFLLWLGVAYSRGSLTVTWGNFYESEKSTEGNSHPLRLHLKSNALGWGMFISNLGVELDFARHWSFSLPVYYSAWDYFTPTVKLRTFSLQPELRYWVDESNDGWFGGIHWGLSYYNIAWGKDWRYQDREGNTPAVGGGIGVGYRMPLGRSQRWRIEFALGGGAYALHYDIFHNEPNGLLTRTEKRTYLGIDHISISFSYLFDLKKRRGQWYE